MVDDQENDDMPVPDSPFPGYGVEEGFELPAWLFVAALLLPLVVYAGWVVAVIVPHI